MVYCVRLHDFDFDIVFYVTVYMYDITVPLQSKYYYIDLKSIESFYNYCYLS